MAHVVLSTFGSLGDVHPYLAIAIALRERGHCTVLACSEVYREKVQAEGIAFSAVRPDIGELLSDEVALAKIWHPRHGSEYLIRKVIIPHVEQSYEDLLKACRGADLVLTHVAGYAGPIAAEALHIRWASIVLQPMMFLSAYDPPFIPPIGPANHLFRKSPVPFWVLTQLAPLILNRWTEPIQRVRTRAGLARSPQNPMMGGQFSQTATLALFSAHFAAPQRDWPPNTSTTGFVFYDRQGQLPGALPEASREVLDNFLDKGPPPVLFTLGSSAVMHPGTFFKESVEAAKSLGVRAVILTGWNDREALADLPPTIYAASYLPYSQIMSRSSAIVHQGGIGTTAQALRAGRPMIVVPWAHDQPDNAERVRRLGVSRTIPRSRYRAARVAKELATLLADPAYAENAKRLGEIISAEDGIGNACKAIEAILASGR